jgi:electron transport complex protein RnfG
MNTTDRTSSAASAVSLSTRLTALLELAGGRHAVVLGGFSLAATLLLTVAYGLTKEPIEQSALEDLRHSLEQVIPASIHDNNPAADTVQLQIDGKSLLVYRARKADRVTGGFEFPVKVTAVTSGCCST